MDAKTRRQAESILSQLCLGRTICGINFVAEPILLLGSYAATDRKPLGPAEVYLHIESGWCFKPSVRSTFGSGSLEELAQIAARLRGVAITGIRLGEQAPDLFLLFAGGEELQVEGHDAQYEPWSVAAGDWSIYALPGDQLTWDVPHPGVTDAA